MLKRIAVIIDPELDCRAVFSAARVLGKATDAVLLAVPCNFAGKKKKAAQPEKEGASKTNLGARKLGEFVRSCATAKIDYEVASSTPLTFKEALSTIQGADMLVLARPAENPWPDKIFEKHLRQLIVRCGCPVHLAAGSARAIKNILIAWDGSTESIRTVKMHVQLFQALKPHYLFILCSDDSVEAQTQLHVATDYISHHPVSAETLSFPGEPAKILSAAFTRLKVWHLLVGLHRRNIYNKKKFGRTSRTLLRDPSIALFLYD
ncbi:universal stress protein [candidate division KSB1 bacterium]|nr:universal stress protein [candidate division KSB1 bacterium]